jgi:hypothetical protein
VQSAQSRKQTLTQLRASIGANIVALFGLTGAADTLSYFTGVGTMAVTSLTAVARTFLAATTQAAARTSILAAASGTNSDITTLAGVTSITSAMVSTLPNRVAQYTLTTLPSAATYNGYEIDVTNATGGSKRCRSSGTVWQILNTTTTVS